MCKPAEAQVMIKNMRLYAQVIPDGDRFISMLVKKQEDSSPGNKPHLKRKTQMQNYSVTPHVSKLLK